jgi:hypothetical protein
MTKMTNMGVTCQVSKPPERLKKAKSLKNQNIVTMTKAGIAKLSGNWSTMLATDESYW